MDEKQNSTCEVVPEGFGHWGISEFCIYCPASKTCAELTKKQKLRLDRFEIDEDDNPR